jgi:acetyltransferase-like isoleucine patch superfamily enzyme
MKGVKVGRHSVIGQCAVLTADAEPYSIYAGMPARKIRGGITWTRDRDG